MSVIPSETSPKGECSRGIAIVPREGLASSRRQKADADYAGVRSASLRARTQITQISSADEWSVVSRRANNIVSYGAMNVCGQRSQSAKSA